MKEDNSQQDEDQISNKIINNNNSNTLHNSHTERTKETVLKKESKPNFHELNLKFGHKLNLNYSDFDRQKGCLSPRLLFKKRKNDSEIIPRLQNPDIPIENNVKIANTLKSTFDTLLDFVQDTYFTQDTKEDSESQPELKSSLNGSAFKFTSLDLLINPLRQKFIWELWSPYELALFHCCICKFGTNFEFYENIIKTKKKEEIIDFYFHWKSSKYYRIWKNNKHKKNKKLT